MIMGWRKRVDGHADLCPRVPAEFVREQPVQAADLAYVGSTVQVEHRTLVHPGGSQVVGLHAIARLFEDEGLDGDPLGDHVLALVLLPMVCDVVLIALEVPAQESGADPEKEKT